MVEKRILKVALEAGVYKQLLDDSGKIIELNIEKTKFTLVNDYGLSEKWASEAVDWLVKAFGTAQSKDTVEVKVATATNVAPPKEKKTKPVTAITTTNSNKTIGRDNVNCNFKCPLFKKNAARQSPVLARGQELPFSQKNRIIWLADNRSSNARSA